MSPIGTNGHLQWLGHSTVLLDLDGTRVVTDPVLTARVAHLRRHGALAEIPADIDAVLISHVHLDHLHGPSLRLLPGAGRFVVPRGAAPLVRRLAATLDDDRVVETTAGDTVAIGPLSIVTTPARHSGRRGPHSRLDAPAVGYVIRSPGWSVYFAGDTDLFDEMAAIGPVDVAALPIWGWGPTLGEGHLDPARAARAAVLVQARIVVPIHWGTLSPAIVRRRRPAWIDEPVDRFRAELGSVGLGDRLRVLAPGQRFALEPS